MPFRLQIVTPDRTMFDADVDSISVPTEKGEITVLPHHTPLLSLVVTGEARIRKPGAKDEYLSVGGGILEVSQTEVLLLLRTAEHVDELDEAKIHAAIEAAHAKLKSFQDQEHQEASREFAETQALLARNLARVHVIRRRRGNRSA